MKDEQFDLEPEEIIHAKYEIISLLGKGWEGEVYLVRECNTGIERAAKFFYPKRNKHGRTSRFYAKKLHKLKNCKMLIQYHFQDEVLLREGLVHYLISEYISGDLLSEYIDVQKGKRLQPFDALHLLYALVCGIEEIHDNGEYHGDLHTENIIVNKKGLGYEVKILDLIQLGSSSGSLKKEDIVDLINVFYETLGGKNHYPNMPKEIKYICSGLKRSLILKKFPNISKLRDFLENIEWSK